MSDRRILWIPMDTEALKHWSTGEGATAPVQARIILLSVVLGVPDLVSTV
jgi:hypothetical protein